MENAVAYQGEVSRSAAGLVIGERDQFLRRLDAAVRRFNQQLEYIDRRSLEKDADPDELLIVTTKAIMEMGNACEAFEKNCSSDKALLKQAQVSFREETAQFFSKSYFMTRARTWPQGYMGDFQTLEGVYRDIPLSAGVGYYLDRYFLATELPAAVRNRKELLRTLLQEELGRRQAPKVLDIACGSCREVFELIPEIKASMARWICLDFDSDALDFAADRMQYGDLQQGQMVFRKYNALKMTKLSRNLQEFGMQDIIYSVGFFDYLPDDILVPMLSSLYALLNPGGVLITSFKDCRKYRAQEYHWFVDWDGFLQRTEEDSRTVLARAGIPPEAVTSVREKSEVIIFLNAHK